MRQRWRVGLIFAFMLLSGAASASDKEACVKSREAMNAFIVSLPNHCGTHEDCDGYYIRGDNCAPPVVLPKAAYEKISEPQLLALQQSIRDTCGKAEHWDARPACGPIPFQARCINHQCVNQFGEKK